MGFEGAFSAHPAHAWLKTTIRHVVIDKVFQNLGPSKTLSPILQRIVYSISPLLGMA